MHVEAMAFAWLAWAYINRDAGNLPDVTNAAAPASSAAVILTEKQP